MSPKSIGSLLAISISPSAHALSTRVLAHEYALCPIRYPFLEVQSRVQVGVTCCGTCNRLYRNRLPPCSHACAGSIPLCQNGADLVT
ncbi:hypothetical protein BV22DRAFT_910409 [Leucogyrophana mollusca]|uniref:Uncharacterized protein n=1 Tax=Leucogyrophana mollusca TaxID=85980 RepID=A0ACB8AZC9_9AGAM|nr:hypothetical protein BV22DRAFT_910409 [Leucogyrophana mollusca]